MRGTIVETAKVLVGLLLGLALGCSGGDSSSKAQTAGVEAGAEGGVETGADSVSDAKVDKDAEAGRDAQAETGADTGVDVGVDAVADTEADAAPDAPIICTPGVTYCTSQTTMAMCNPAGTGPVGLELNCRDTRNTDCNPAIGDCYFCMPNQTFCASDMLTDLCNAEGTAGMGALMGCFSGQPCNWATNQCYACMPGQMTCVTNDTWKLCNADGTDTVGPEHICPAPGCNPVKNECMACKAEGEHCHSASECCDGNACSGQVCANPCGGPGEPCGSAGCCQAGLYCQVKTPSMAVLACCRKIGGTCTADKDCCGALVCNQGVCDCRLSAGAGNECLDLEDCCPDDYGLRYCHRPYSNAYGACCRVAGPCMSNAVCCTWAGYSCHANGNCGL